MKRAIILVTCGLVWVLAWGCVPRQYYRPPRMDCETEACRTERAFKALEDFIAFADLCRWMQGRYPSDDLGFGRMLGMTPVDPWGHPYFYRLSPLGHPMVVSMGTSTDPFNPDMTVPLWSHNGPWIYLDESDPPWATRMMAYGWKVRTRFWSRHPELIP